MSVVKQAEDATTFGADPPSTIPQCSAVQGGSNVSAGSAFRRFSSMISSDPTIGRAAVESVALAGTRTQRQEWMRESVARTG
jgi:hypothetical protein